MENRVRSVLRYFAVFQYPPTFDEIYTFLPQKISTKNLRREIDLMKKNKSIVSKTIGSRERYELSTSKRSVVLYQRRFDRGTYWRNCVQRYLTVVRWIPCIRFLGVSGSLSMLNVKSVSDIDIFVITQAQSIWTARFLLLLYKKLLIFYDPIIGKKLCFNLFFDETSLCLRSEKRSIYIGHEILQVNPILDKDQTHKRFISGNSWVSRHFPNVQIKSTQTKRNIIAPRQALYLSFIERFLRKIQRGWLDRKGYSFQDFGSQLWLIQDDFEKKIEQMQIKVYK